MQNLILITNAYPFGLAEASFLRPEVKVLAEHFQMTVVARNTSDLQTSVLPDGTQVFRYDSKKGYSPLKLLLKTFLSKPIYQEIYTLLHVKQFSLTRLKKALRYYMRALHFASYLEQVRQELPEKVVLYTYWNDYSVLSASMVKRKGDKLVSRAHRVDLYLRKENDMYLPMKAFSNRKTDLLAFVGNEGKQYFEETFSNTVPTAVCRLGVPQQAVRAPFTEKRQISVLSFSYLSPVKQVEKIPEALALLPDTLQVHWVHIGDGILHEKVTNAAERLLAERQNTDYCFLGAMDNAAAMQYISETQFDFLLNVSASEGIPVTMMESMSFGIPVIATDVGGVREIVRHGENGLLLSANADAQEIADAVQQYSALPYAEKCRLRECAYTTWNETYHAEKNYANFADILLE
ncbi:MAG: glycosyltransferase [Candidatus Fimenecus sp.]